MSLAREGGGGGGRCTRSTEEMMMPASHRAASKLVRLGTKMNICLMLYFCNRYLGAETYCHCKPMIRHVAKLSAQNNQNAHECAKVRRKRGRRRRAECGADNGRNMPGGERESCLLQNLLTAVTHNVRQGASATFENATSHIAPGTDRLIICRPNPQCTP